MITWQTPLLGLDWDKITTVRVTLESPYKGAGLRWRLGTMSAKQNLNHNPKDRSSGPQFWPGAPVMFPEDAPAIAGDSERNSWLMSANINAMQQTRTGPVPDPTQQAAFIAFGYFMAPREVEGGGIEGFTIGSERTRVAAYWGWYKMPKGDGTMHPPMNRIGPPDIPDVSVRPLTKNMNPIKVDGKEVVIRVREFWDFDDPNQYEALPGQVEAADAMFEGLTRDELNDLRDLVRGKRAKTS